MFESLQNYKSESLSAEQVWHLEMIAESARRDILRMTTEAESGHPGGSLSSIDIYLLILAILSKSGGDRIVVSHGHTSAGLYAALAHTGYVRREDVIRGFRRMGTVFEGHPSIEVPGVTWCSGALGQGLSAACGFAAAARRCGTHASYGHIYVVMGDGEQAKGQLSEAREFAANYRLSNLTAVIDANGLQASGSLDNIMRQNIAGKYSSADWDVTEADGHDFNAIYAAFRYLRQSSKPGLLIAHTVMGKSVCGRENDFSFHGSPLKPSELAERFSSDSAIDSRFISAQRGTADCCVNSRIYNENGLIKTEKRRIYGANTAVELRFAFGTAVGDIASDNGGKNIAVFVCDLRESLKLKHIADHYPSSFYECGIAEQNALTAAAAMAKEGITVFYAGFAVFAIGEVYSQLRMAEINRSPLKIVATHCGLDVGEDGKTHQCLDYISLLSNMTGIKTVIPADPNHADILVRYAAYNDGAFCVCMGRSKSPVLTDENGEPFYNSDYKFSYGKGDWLRKGRDAVIVTAGAMAFRALKAREMLLEKGIEAGIYITSCPGCFDREDMEKIALSGLVVSYEDHFVQNGIGAMTGAYMMEQGLPCRFIRMGAAQHGQSGSPDELYRAQGLLPGDAANMILQNINKK